MNGDQKTTTPESEWQHKPVDTPASLSEPSQRRSVPTLVESSQSRDATKAPEGTQPIGAIDHSPASSGFEAEGVDDENFYHPEDDASLEVAATPDAPPATSEKAVEWISSGDELRLRASAWRIRMTLLSLGAAAIIYGVTRDIVSAGSVGVVGLLFGLLGSRKPPSLAYTLDNRGITIGQKHYTYDEFRAFTVTDDTMPPSINLVPLKRFLPLLAVHYDPKRRDEIVDILAAHLPLEVYKRDAIDSIINKVKF